MFVGAEIHCFCSGYFGRDCYHDKRIEAQGYDWIVARCPECGPVFAQFGSHKELHDEVTQWIKDESCW